ncbi:MAG TPA: transketolase [Devosia sp.]|nr:transketolase [Devosia sp.]
MEQMPRPENTQNFSRVIRADALRMVHKAGASHIGSCLSVADMLAVLYGETMRVRPHEPGWPSRDRFILSKGHAAAALYSTLARRGFFSPTLLETFCAFDSTLLGHVSHHVPGVEFSTGSLGHGLSLAAGIALAATLNGSQYRSFVILSDGECDEGSTWEAALFAGHWRLKNLIALVDYNKIQSFGRIADVLDLEPFADKWRAFGWDAIELDGHDHAQLSHALGIVRARPTVLICHTTKGKGVSFMEDKLEWHYKSPDSTQLARALAEVGA